MVLAIQMSVALKKHLTFLRKMYRQERVLIACIQYRQVFPEEIRDAPLDNTGILCTDLKMLDIKFRFELSFKR